MKRTGKPNRPIKPGGVDEYISDYPKEIQTRLQEMRTAILEVAPSSVETMSYFDMPGYSYEGYDYNGMFAWFSVKKPFVRLHVRPLALVTLKKDLEGFTKTKAIVNFPIDKRIPKTLVKRLVKLSLKSMREGTK